MMNAIGSGPCQRPEPFSSFCLWTAVVLCKKSGCGSDLVTGAVILAVFVAFERDNPMSETKFYNGLQQSPPTSRAACLHVSCAVLTHP